jgi:hypothetical protein
MLGRHLDDGALGPDGVDLLIKIEMIRNFTNVEPFQPFVIHPADGRDVPVNHREFIASVPSGRTVTVYQPDDTMNVIDLLLVTGLDVRPAPSGSGKRRKA